MTESTQKPGIVTSASEAVGIVANSDDAVVRVISTDEAEVVASVAATPSGAIVARMEELAARYDIPLVQDALLTNLLVKVPSGDEIPDNLFAAISEVLSCVYSIIDTEERSHSDL
ncbi:MAG: EscU/YscU/HrcU family type III secretion system export apparatus switch protein [Halioglobus sp.]